MLYKTAFKNVFILCIKVFFLVEDTELIALTLGCPLPTPITVTRPWELPLLSLAFYNHGPHSGITLLFI